MPHILLVHSCINRILMCHTCMYTCIYYMYARKYVIPSYKFDRFLSGFQFIPFLTNTFYNISILSKHIYNFSI